MSKGNIGVTARSIGRRGFLTLLANTVSFTEDNLLPLAISTCSGSEPTIKRFSNSLTGDNELMLEYIQPKSRKRRERIRLMIVDFLKRTYFPSQSTVPRPETQECVGNKNRGPRFGAFCRSFGRTSVWNASRRQKPDRRDRRRATFFTLRRRQYVSSVPPMQGPTELHTEDVLIASGPTLGTMVAVSSLGTENPREKSVQPGSSSSDVSPAIHASRTFSVGDDLADITACTYTVKDVRFHPTREKLKPYAFGDGFNATTRSRSSSVGSSDDDSISSPITMTNESDENTQDGSNLRPESVVGSDGSYPSFSTDRNVDGRHSGSIVLLPVEDIFQKSVTSSAAASINFMSICHLRGSSPEIDSFAGEKALDFSSDDELSSEYKLQSIENDPVSYRHTPMPREKSECNSLVSPLSPETYYTPVSNSSIRSSEGELSPRAITANAQSQQLYDLVRQSIAVADISLTSDTEDYSILHDCESEEENDDTNGNNMLRKSSFQTSLFNDLDPNILDLRALIREDKKLSGGDHDVGAKTARVVDVAYDVARRMTPSRRLSECREHVAEGERDTHGAPRRRESVRLIHPLDLRAQEEDVSMAFEDISLSPHTGIDKDNTSVETITQTVDWQSSRASVYFKHKVYNMVSSFSRARNRHSVSTYNSVTSSQIDLRDNEEEEDEMLPRRVIIQIRQDVGQNMIFLTDHDHTTPGVICTRCMEESRYFETVNIKFRASVRRLRSENAKKGMAVTQEDLDIVASLARSEAQMDMLSLY
ncbi:hypothetical protein V1517DRAFT_73434 [Lipomyces orientalis]|uniref:Uncharacterized protein n=1 Tax=Lipomyces orientalis TaxID=1233043 RepID=A0ACC3TTM9_9ASCO